MFYQTWLREKELDRERREKLKKPADKKEEIKELGPKKVDFNHLFEVNTTKFSAWLQNGSISAGFELVLSRTEKPRRAQSSNNFPRILQ